MGRVQYRTRIEKAIKEMRGCVTESERARDRYFQVRADLREQMFKPHEIDIMCGDKSSKAGQMAQAAIADNRWYMALAEMYATVAQAEMQLYAYGLEGNWGDLDSAESLHQPVAMNTEQGLKPAPDDKSWIEVGR